MISKRNQILVQKLVESLYALRVLPIIWNSSKRKFELNQQAPYIPVIYFLHILCSILHAVLPIYHLIIKDLLSYLMEVEPCDERLTMIEVGVMIYSLIFHSSSLTVMIVFLWDLERVPTTLNFVQNFACSLNGKTSKSHCVKLLIILCIIILKNLL